MKKTLLAISALVLGAGVMFAIVPKALAYRGDPSIQGPNCSSEQHEAVQTAIRNKDYNAWKNLMGDRGVTRRITEQNFARFAEMVQLRLNGKTDEANQIRQELGLGLHNGSGSGQDQRMGIGRNWNK